MSDNKSIIMYTKTDEAPALATYSLFPMVKAFTSIAGIEMNIKDISLTGRIIANFSDYLKADQKMDNALEELGELAKKPEANIIKLPNISASIPQLKSAIKELQDKGYGIPDFSDEPKTDEQKSIRDRYAKLLGSAVNPVLREGNSDRRVAPAVKDYAKNNPHQMGTWNRSSKSHVGHMMDGDFYSTEQSYVLSKEQEVRIDFVSEDGDTKVLKENIKVLDKEVIDSAVMSKERLRNYFADKIEDAKRANILFSLHLKATMMKVSDPIIFGHCVEVFFKDVFSKYESLFADLGVNANNGLGDVFNKIQSLPEKDRKEIEIDIKKCYENGPELAMVNSDKGITNLHVPSDVIIDASMPAAIRSGGKMWDSNGDLQDMIACIPDRSYAGVYQEVINFCKENGAFEVQKMGSVSNVGLMAQKAEEYGSHDKTFTAPANGVFRVVDESGIAVMEHKVEEGDIFRMCQTKDLAIKDWIKLGIKRAKATGCPAVFWLDERRAHDRNLILIVNKYLLNQDTDNIEVKILSPIQACLYTCRTIKEGKDIISVTGNVLRDYLTDLFPILELGTSAKMLSIVPLLAGGGLFETGAGGSAPKHVQQFLKENHLRWDSLGEFLALAVSIEHLGSINSNPKAKVLAECLNKANSTFLKENKSPSRKVHEIDNRGSHYYLAMFWAQALAEQTEDSALKEVFAKLAEQLVANEDKIIQELNEVQGVQTDIGGYYLPDVEKVCAVMRPSDTLNYIIDAFNKQ